MVRISENTSKPSNVHPRFEAMSAFHCVRLSERYQGERPKMADSLMVLSLRCAWAAPFGSSRTKLTPISGALGTECYVFQCSTPASPKHYLGVCRTCQVYLKRALAHLAT